MFGTSGITQNEVPDTQWIHRGLVSSARGPMAHVLFQNSAWLAWSSASTGGLVGSEKAAVACRFNSGTGRGRTASTAAPGQDVLGLRLRVPAIGVVLLDGIRPAQPCFRHRTLLSVRDAPHVATDTGQLSIRAAPSAHRGNLWARLPPAPSHPDAALSAGPEPPRDLPRTGRRVRSHGSRRALMGRARLPSLSALRHSRSRIRTSSVCRLWLRLLGRVLLRKSGSMSVV